MSLDNAGVERREQLLNWQQTYQLGMPWLEEPTLHNQPLYTAHHQQQNPDYAYGPPTYQTADHLRQQRNPLPVTQPWQQPRVPPDWQRSLQPQPYGSHDFGTTDLVAHGPAVTAVFDAEHYTVPMTMEPQRTSLTDHQTRLNDYTQPRSTCNAVDWYNRPARIQGQPNHNPNLRGFLPYQFQQQQHRPILQPSCWDLPRYQPPPGYPPDDQQPVHQTAWWEPSGNRVQLGYEQYEQQHYPPADYGEPPMRRPTGPPLYGQSPYTDTESLNVPPRQYTTSTFGQPPNSSDAPPQNPFACYHSGLPEYQSTPPPYQPPSSPTCWDTPGLRMPQGYTTYDQPTPTGCPPPRTTDSSRLPSPYLHHDASSSSIRAAAAVPLPPMQRPPPATISPPCCRDTRSMGEEDLCREVFDEYISHLEKMNEKERKLEEEHPPLDQEKEEEALLDEEEGDDSTKEVKKVIASYNVARVSSQNVVGNWGQKGGGAYTDLQVITCVFVDLNVGDVTSRNHRSTSIDTDARLIPPRYATPCLSILGRVNKASILALNYHGNNVASESAMSHIRHGPLLVIADENGEWRRSTIRCAFDPGGDTSPKLCSQLFSLLRGFHLEDKVDFNRGRVDTILYHNI